LVGVVQHDGEVPVPVGPPAGTVEAFGERVGQTMLDRVFTHLRTVATGLCNLR
jgi:hypothetical protein